MSKQEAVAILMLSPFYFRQAVAERKVLLDEFYQVSNQAKKGDR